MSGNMRARATVEKRQWAYAVRGELGLEPKTLVITTRSMAAVGIFPSTMTVAGVFVEDEEHEQAAIEAAAAFCEAMTGYPLFDVSFSVASTSVNKQPGGG
ncbi:MAG TPA: hypothetical protein VGD78_21275 [Chthoniobacterales bacterium]